MLANDATLENCIIGRLWNIKILKENFIEIDLKIFIIKCLRTMFMFKQIFKFSFFFQ